MPKEPIDKNADATGGAGKTREFKLTPDNFADVIKEDGLETHVQSLIDSAIGKALKTREENIRTEEMAKAEKKYEGYEPPKKDDTNKDADNTVKPSAEVKQLLETVEKLTTTVTSLQSGINTDKQQTLINEKLTAEKLPPEMAKYVIVGEDGDVDKAIARIKNDFFDIQQKSIDTAVKDAQNPLVGSGKVEDTAIKAMALDANKKQTEGGEFTVKAPNIGAQAVPAP